MQDVARPEELGGHGDGSEGQADVAAGVKGGVQVVLVVEDVLAHGVVDQRQDDGEAPEAQQHQQRRLVLFQYRLHSERTKDGTLERWLNATYRPLCKDKGQDRRTLAQRYSERTRDRTVNADSTLQQASLKGQETEP